MIFIATTLWVIVIPYLMFVAGYWKGRTIELKTNGDDVMDRSFVTCLIKPLHRMPE